MGPAEASARTRTTLLALYFASGMVGLLDEVVFFKYLSLTFGATAYASSAVLVAFMAGLALGAALAARLDARVTRPLRAYGALEVAVGLACAASPLLFGLVTRAYVGLAAGTTSLAVLSVVRGALAGAVVLVPTVAMGATLPLVARVAGSFADGGRTVTLLYGANTAGGACGAVLGAYALIPGIGLAASVRVGACVSVAVGLAALLLARGAGPLFAAREAAAATSTPPTPLGRGTVAAAASGLLVFACEVVFVHLLALVDGTSVYVFGLVLAVFLVSLAAGAAASRPLARRAGDGALAVSLAVSGLALAGTLPVWDHLPDVFVALGPYVVSWPARELVRALVAAAAIGIPATCMGTTFPLVLAAVSDRADRGAQTGRVTAINTVASIVGSLAGGFLLLPALGSQRALGTIAVAYAVAALVVTRPGARKVVAGLAVAAAGIVVVVPRWDLARLSSGTNVYFAPQPEQGRVVWINEDVHGGVVTVTEGRGLHTLWTNGKYQGDDGPQMSAQRAFADVPSMFVPRFGRALVVGLGTGTTLGALAAYPYERIELAELSPGIVHAARTFFGCVNGNVFDDPRVVVEQADGRNVLLVDRGRFDLVTIELTSIWFAGAANLYNREFYEVAAGKLGDQGILSQWIQLHHTTLREIASQLATVRAVFPHAAFFVRGDQGIVVASLAPLVARRPTGIDMDDLVLADDTMDAFVHDVCAEAHTTPQALLSTDDDLLLEYATPRNNVPGRRTIPEMVAELRRWRSSEVAERVGAR